MASITRYVEQRLKLRVNREKSVVSRTLRRPFLGLCLRPRMGEVRVLVDPKALRRAKDRLRALTSRRWGVSMERRVDEINRFTVGWTAYFRLADTPTPFEDLDEWFRRQLRQVRWKEWKRMRTRRRKLRALGISEAQARQWACSRRGTGASLAPRFSPSPYPTATGSTTAYRASSIPTAASRMLSEPPDADPHVRGVGGARVSLAPTRSEAGRPAFMHWSRTESTSRQFH